MADNFEQQNIDQQDQGFVPLPKPTPEDIKEIRKRILIFGIVMSVILVAAWGVATYFAKVNYDKVAAEAQKVQQDIEALKQRRAQVSAVPDGWQTYRNEEYGFEFKYPEGFLINLISADDFKNTELSDSFTGNRVYALARLKNTVLSVVAGDPAFKPGFSVTVIKDTPGYSLDEVIDDNLTLISGPIDTGPEGDIYNKNLEIINSSLTLLGYPTKRISIKNYHDSGDTISVLLKDGYIYEFKTNSFVEDNSSQILSTFKFIE